jgi:quercetin dioxygenase-like cupin family protein
MAFLSPGDMLKGEPLPGWRGHFFHAENMTFSLYEIDAGAPALHEHLHREEEVWNVVDGEIVLSVAGQERILRAGDAAIVPPDTPHSARVIAACRVVVADHPRRDALPGRPS